MHTSPRKVSRLGSAMPSGRSSCSASPPCSVESCGIVAASYIRPRMRFAEAAPISRLPFSSHTATSITWSSLLLRLRSCRSFSSGSPIAGLSGASAGSLTRTPTRSKLWDFGFLVMTQTMPPSNHALQRTRRLRSGCNRLASWVAIAELGSIGSAKISCTRTAKSSTQ